MLFSAMLVVGLTGGLATGKSTVARLFRQCGALVVDADLLARQVVEPGRPAWRDLVRAFGTSIFNDDRTLNRTALAHIVFRNPSKLRRLNRIVHPRVAREQARLIKAMAKTGPRAVVIYDAPVLIEAGAHRRMDRLIVVTADQPTQVARLLHRNHLSRAEAIRRIRAQMPLADKVKLADYVLDGTLPLPQLRRHVKTVYRELRRLA